MPTGERSTSEPRRESPPLWLLGPEKIDYGMAWDLQRAALKARLAGLVPDLLLLVEHPPVYTVGKRGEMSTSWCRWNLCAGAEQKCTTSTGVGT